MSLNVLVADDSLVMRAMIVKTLRLTGLDLGEVHQVANGREGLDVLNGKWIDILLVDINMPVMNGEEMIQKIRANPETRELPVVVVSSEGSQTRIDRLREMGAQFIQKPFEPEALRTILVTITGVGDEQKN